MAVLASYHVGMAMQSQGNNSKGFVRQGGRTSPRTAGFPNFPNLGIWGKWESGLAGSVTVSALLDWLAGRGSDLTDGGGGSAGGLCLLFEERLKLAKRLPLTLEVGTVFCFDFLALAATVCSSRSH